MGENVEIRTLAVRQPWAGLIVVGQKKIEYRTWETPYRGPFLIVGSARKPTADELEETADDFPRFKKVKDSPCFTRCAVVGIACLDRIKNNGTKHDPDCEFYVTHPVALKTPISAKGKLMLYRSRIDADTPLDSSKYPTIGDYLRVFSK